MKKLHLTLQMSDEPHDYGGDANLNTLARVGPNFRLQFPDLPYYIEPGDRDKYATIHRHVYVGLQLFRLSRRWA